MGTYVLAMRFLRATRNARTAPWWRHASMAQDKPPIVRELLRDESVVCDRAEEEAALAWARAQPGWREDEPPLWVQRPW